LIEQQGRVVNVCEGSVRVRIGASSGCSACDRGQGCGAGLFGRLLRRRPVELDLENTIAAAAGQPVVVGLPESLFLSLVVRLYLYPLLGGLAGAVLGHWLALIQGAGDATSDLSTLTGALLAGALVLWLVRRRGPEFFDRDAVHLLRIAKNEVAKQ
jgi:sigma-E factor negative regulatory protein RseC